MANFIKWAKKNGIKMAQGLNSKYHDPRIMEPDCGTILFDEFNGNW